MKSAQLKILIVDDDERVLIDLEHALEGEGYTTATAWSGEEALRLSGTGNFHLFLIDDHLNDVSSSLLAEQLQQMQPSVPLLFMRARADDKAVTQTSHPAVCKWEHDNLKATVRGFLAA
jgi:CheY-like chemotaxis protein